MLLNDYTQLTALFGDYLRLYWLVYTNHLQCESYQSAT